MLLREFYETPVELLISLSPLNKCRLLVCFDSDFELAKEIKLNKIIN